jgi:hypothetical protein
MKNPSPATYAGFFVGNKLGWKFPNWSNAGAVGVF